MKLNYPVLRLSVFLVIFISGCIQQESIQKKSQYETIPSTSPTVGLGNLCIGEKECIDFCLNNRGQCEDYCEGGQNELCQKVFPFEERTDYAKEEKVQEQIFPFKYPPAYISKVTYIEPLGARSTGPGHITPVDHHYFRIFHNNSVNVYSPADGVIIVIEKHAGNIGPNNLEWAPSLPDAQGNWDDYRIEIQHSITISSIYAHIDELPTNIAREAPQQVWQQQRVSIPVKAGEVIGKFTRQVDYNVVDQDVVLPGLLVPENYAERAPWKIHVPNTLDYFADDVKEQIVAKLLRTKEPLGGKIDYDIDGRLVGNWFKEGWKNRKDMFGLANFELNALVIAYDYIDPEHIIISMADYNGEQVIYAVKSNSPDPADVGISTGPVKYELVGWDYFNDNKKWDRKSLVKGLKIENNDKVEGTLLVQLIEKRKLKVEAFPEKTASQVNGFTSNAKIYER